MVTIIWVGFSMSLFGGTLMAAKLKRSFPDIILAIWLLLLSLDFLLRASEINYYGKVLMSNSFLLFNPILYVYTKSLTHANFKLKWTQLLHSLPFIVLEIIIHTHTSLITLDTFVFQTTPPGIFYGFIGVSLLSWIIYLTLSIKLLIKHTQRLENEYSNKNRFNNIIWLKFVTYFYIFYSVVISVIGVYFGLNQIESRTLVILVSCVSIFLVYSFSFFGLLQAPIFKSDAEQSEHKNDKIAIPNSKLQSIKLGITEYFEKEKPYLNPEFNMEVFAEKMKIPKHKLTWILNNEIGKNFFVFVNYYRVKDAKKYLTDKNNIYSIEAIGYDCGFNSKSSFFTNFKKITGLTPLQYKNKNTA